MQFIVAIVGMGFKGLYFCEPPQTVIHRDVEPIVIGAGAAVVEPLLPTILPGVFPLKPTLLRLAYLMYRAKKDQALVGGPTDLLVLPFPSLPLPPSYEGVVWADRDEIETAEVLGEFVDDMVRQCVMGLLSGESQAELERFLAAFNSLFLDKAGMFSKVQFRSVRGAEPTEDRS